RSHAHPAPASRTHHTLTAVASTQTPAVPAKPAVAVAVATTVKLSLAASKGDCWLEIRTASAKGKILYVATLLKGKSYKVAGAKLWVRMGAPQNVDLLLNGDPVAIPSATQDVLVTPAGVKATA